MEIFSNLMFLLVLIAGTANVSTVIEKQMLRLIALERVVPYEPDKLPALKKARREAVISFLIFAVFGVACLAGLSVGR